LLFEKHGRSWLGARPVARCVGMKLMREGALFRPWDKLLEPLRGWGWRVVSGASAVALGVTSSVGFFFFSKTIWAGLTHSALLP
jgi:hypothetical protein